MAGEGSCGNEGVQEYKINMLVSTAVAVQIKVACKERPEGRRSGVEGRK